MKIGFTENIFFFLNFLYKQTIENIFFMYTRNRSIIFHCYLEIDWCNLKPKKKKNLNFKLQKKKRDNIFPFYFFGLSWTVREDVSYILSTVDDQDLPIKITLFLGRNN